MGQKRASRDARELHISPHTETEVASASRGT